MVVTEITLNNLLAGDAIDNRDFLDRVDLLRTLGHPVLISNFGEFYRLANYLQRHTSKLIGLVMGVPILRRSSRKNTTPIWPAGSSNPSGGSSRTT